MNSVEQISLNESNICIKTETYENDIPDISNTSFEMCSTDDIKYEMIEPIVKIKAENAKDEMMHDPLDVSSETKVTVKENQQEQIISRPYSNTVADSTEEKEINKSKSHRIMLINQDQSLAKNEKVCKSKKHTCPVCNRLFQQKSHLNDHIRTHTGFKPFLCAICKKSFNTKSTMVNHMLVHSGEKPHTCNICQQVFSRKSSLNDHKLIHSGIKPFACNECDKSFRQKTDLVKHKRIHTGDKSYVCDVCSKAFINKTYLTIHMRIHTGEKPYSCNVCMKSFAAKSNLNQHKKIHKNL